MRKRRLRKSLLRENAGRPKKSGSKLDCENVLSKDDLEKSFLFEENSEKR